MATSHGSKGNGRNGEDRLWEAFAAPSDAARPHTFWHWMNGNVTKEGITADLEAMANAGMGGVYLYMVEGKLTESLPVYVDRPVRILTPEWFAMMRHAAEECKRLGLELSLMNCTGWSTSGGPWVPPEKSMMRIAWSETYHKGPGRIAGSLPLPPCDYACYQNLTKPYPHIHESVPPEKRFYRDMAVLAYRLDPSAAKAAALWPPKVSCSEPDQNPAHAIDGDGSTAVGVETGGFVRFEFPEPVVARGVEYLGDGCELQASDDGSNWSKVADLPGPRAWGFPQTLPVPETKARYFQLRFSGDACMRHLKLSGDSLVQDYGPKAAFHGLWVDSKVAEDRIGPPTPPWAAATIRSNDILDLTDRLRADGTLDWEAPEGEWMIVRLGCAPIGRLNAPCAREFAGLECNKLDPEAVALHFDAYTGRVADELEDLIGTGFHYGYVDSWEAGDLNFTPQFIEEFKKRRGYNPVPFLLVHAGGRVVDSPAIADRFLWDVRRTIGDLIADYYFSKLNDLCHARGLKFQGEISGVMQQVTADQLQIKGRCDLPMGEFQMPNFLYGDHWARWDPVEAASASHIYGRPVAAAEAFTTFCRWQTDPYGLKGIGDLAFAMGINRLVFHSWAHHPWPDRAPGMTMGPFGVNFSRMNTWWGRPAKAYVDYLRRCSQLLQQGRFVADILYFYGEGAPNTLPSKNLIRPALPDGYAYDGCDADTLRTRVEVKDGRLALPDGMSYRVLVLKDDPRLTPETLGKIKALVQAGVTVIGPKPQESPSLMDYPRCDERVRALADDVWNRVTWNRPVGEVLKSMGVEPDVEIIRRDGGDGPVEWTHRRTDGEEWYFISNQQNIIDHGSSLEICERRYDSFAINDLAKDTIRMEVSFRVVGKQPELWDPVTGTRRDLPEFRTENGRTIVPLTLPPSGSCFVVFRRTVPAKTNTEASRNFPELKPIVPIDGPWTVAFDPKWGGPARVVFNTLEDWTTRPEPGIKYYSGRATYKKNFDATEAFQTKNQRVFLDLGRLRSLAEVRLNGRDLGVLWCPPWRVEVTGLLKPRGNELKIDIVNLWANRIIGDLNLPEPQRLTWTSLQETIGALKPDNRLVPSGLYGPVTLAVEE